MLVTLIVVVLVLCSLCSVLCNFGMLIIVVVITKKVRSMMYSVRSRGTAPSVDPERTLTVVTSAPSVHPERTLTSAPSVHPERTLTSAPSVHPERTLEVVTSEQAINESDECNSMIYDDVIPTDAREGIGIGLKWNRAYGLVYREQSQ